MTLEETIEYVNNPILQYDGEIWKEHPIYKGYYGSNYGRVKYYNKQQKKEIIKKKILNKRNERFLLRISKKTILAYRFILACFEGINDKMQVDHIDSVPYNDSLNNLRYVTRLENNRNPNSIKKRIPSKTTNFRFKIEQIDKNTNEIIKIWDCAMDAEKELKLYGLNKHIFDVCSGKRKTTYGYIWKYHKEENIEGEIWKKHPSLDIECSSEGRIKWKRKNGFEYITYGCKTTTDYLLIKKMAKLYRVHRLIAETFIPNPNNKPFVNHKDCNTFNNKVNNLEWVTQQENMFNPKTHSKMSTKIKAININDNSEIIFSSINEAGRYGFHMCSITSILKGEQKTPYKNQYLFEYVNE